MGVVSIEESYHDGHAKKGPHMHASLNVPLFCVWNVSEGAQMASPSMDTDVHA